MKKTMILPVLAFVVSAFSIPGAIIAASGPDLRKQTMGKGRLFVETEPNDARVRVLNIRPKFYQGMELEPGRYHVEVSAAGHKTQKRWIELGPGEDKHVDIRLVKLQMADAIGPDGKVFTNNIGMKFVYIAPGTFVMGSPIDESRRRDEEKQHRVTLTKGFHMGATEVTQGQWRRIMGNNPSHFTNCGDDCPVESVSWNDCQEFIRRLNRMEKTDKYRLPSEAEWEYACRAGSETPLYTGPLEVLGHNNSSALDEIAWYGGNSCVEYDGAHNCSKWPERQYACSRCGPLPVGRKKPNVWGLYDMLGNVWEWCHDSYEEYPSGPVTDPTGPSSGWTRVDRGCCWDTFAADCRSAARDELEPDVVDNLIGFRLARTP